MKLAIFMIFMSCHPGIEAVTKILGDPSNTNTILFPLTNGPDKFILQDKDEKIIITNDPPQGLAIVAKQAEKYRTINSIEGIIDVSDLAVTNHNIGLLAKNIVNPTLFKTEFNKTRMERARQSKNLVHIPKFNGFIPIESKNSKANITLSYPNCEKFCFSKQSYIPSTIAEIEGAKKELDKDNYFWINTKLTNKWPLTIYSADGTKQIYPMDEGINCSSTFYHMKNHEHQQVTEIKSSNFW